MSVFNYINNKKNNCFINTAAQLLFKLKGFCAFVNYIIECDEPDKCYVCLVKEEHHNRVNPSGQKIPISWESPFVQGLDPKYKADTTYDALMFLEKLIGRMAKDCKRKHSDPDDLPFKLFCEIFNIVGGVDDKYKLQLVSLIDPKLEINEGEIEANIVNKLDKINYEKQKEDNKSHIDDQKIIPKLKITSNIIVAELPNGNKSLPKPRFSYGSKTYEIVTIGIYDEEGSGHCFAMAKNKALDSWTRFNCLEDEPITVSPTLKSTEYVKIAIYETNVDDYPVSMSSLRVYATITKDYEGSTMKRSYEKAFEQLCEDTTRFAEIERSGAGIGAMRNVLEEPQEYDFKEADTVLHSPNGPMTSIYVIPASDSKYVLSLLQKYKKRVIITEGEGSLCPDDSDDDDSDDSDDEEEEDLDDSNEEQELEDYKDGAKKSKLQEEDAEDDTGENELLKAAAIKKQKDDAFLADLVSNYKKRNLAEQDSNKKC